MLTLMQSMRSIAVPAVAEAPRYSSDSAQIGGDTVTSTEKRQRFRALLTGQNCVHPADVFDPLSARMADDLGFECGMFAGSVASMVVPGAPDIVLITLTEFADQLRRI
jgi:2-methylisocitrate lyase-like PEP mutase family enzyme